MELKKIKRSIGKKYQYYLNTLFPKLASKRLYKKATGNKLNLNNPKLFNEKLMWLKLNEYSKNPLVAKCADKYKVREYVKENDCSELLNELIGVYDNVEQIDFDNLPNQFVLKCNHGAGYNIICKDKEKLDINKTKDTLKKWMNEDYWKAYAELNYKSVEKKIICEKYIKNDKNEDLDDYKFYCFNGKAEFVMICIGRNTTEHVKFYFMDRNWKLMKINPSGFDEPDDLKIEKPKCIDKMFEYAEKLSKPFPFVRVDFYCVKDKVVFGELTFTPAGCIDTDYTEDAHKTLGDMIDLSKYINKK